MNPGPEDHELVQRAQGGESAPFEELVRRHRGIVTAYVTRHLGRGLRTRVEVEDLVQETFLRAWKDLRLYRGESERSFGAWLDAITKNVVQECGRRLRAKKVDLRREVPIDGDLKANASASGMLENALQASGVSSSRILRRRERFDRLKEALRALSPRHRQVIVLTRVRKLSMEDAARHMNSSPKAVSALLARALTQLRSTFGPTVSMNLPEGSLEDLDDMENLGAPRPS